jgi:hypothetical protein
MNLCLNRSVRAFVEKKALLQCPHHALEQADDAQFGAAEHMTPLGELFLQIGLTTRQVEAMTVNQRAMTVKLPSKDQSWCSILHCSPP